MLANLRSKMFSNSSRRTSEEYMLLESDDPRKPDSSFSTWLIPRTTRRLLSRGRFPSCTRFFVYLATRFIFVASVLFVTTFGFSALVNGLPPLYAEIRQFENSISMRNAPIGSTNRFIRFPGHNTGKGMNNYLQELYFMAHIAYLSNRTFVYDDYVWSHNPTPYTLQGFSIIPSHLPLHVVVSGSESGSAILQKDNGTDFHGPRAVSAQWYKSLCPSSERITINPPGGPNSGDGAAIVEFWKDLLGKMSERCVEVDPRRQPIFHFDLFSSSRALSAWPSMRDSPVLKGHSWSPLVLGALSRNLPLVVSPSSSPLSDTVPHLLAMHVRRGDFEGHCYYLAQERLEYQWIHQYPELPDQFSPESVEEAEREQYYVKHCWVELHDIVQRARELRAMSISNTPLRSVYIMTNGEAAWITSVKEALFKDGWEDVKTTKDLVLDRWERYVDEGVDMAIAERAGIFVGNGFSSLSSNVIMLRMIAGKPIESNRFW